MEQPEYDDPILGRLDDMLHQMRLLTIRVDTLQVAMRTLRYYHERPTGPDLLQRYAERPIGPDLLQRTLGDVLKGHQQLHEHHRTISGRLAMYVEQQTAINQGVQTTLARLEALLARVVPQGEPGREA